MGFKQYLTEIPWFDQGIEISCPFKGHSGGDIKGGDIKWFFDVATEYVKNGRYKKRLLDFHGFFGKPTGKVPILCRSDDKVFMYNAKTGKSYAPTTDEDIDFCKVWIDAMVNTPTNQQLGINPTILTTEEEK
jgi:hypothetical protein